MSPLAGYKLSKTSTTDCTAVTTMAEQELSAFFNAVAQLFGAEEAELSAEEWLRELIDIDSLPASTREWRLITAHALTRLARRVGASSLSTELQIA